MTRTLTRDRRSLLLAAAIAAATVAPMPGAVPAPPPAPAVSDVEVVVARGTSEPGTLGIIVGDNVLAETQRALPARTVTAYAVNYPAGLDATSPRIGIVDTVQHGIAAAAACPAQAFVLVGYSQGA